MENNNLTTLIVENSAIQEHLDRAVALSVSQVVEIMAEKNQHILEWVQEEQALKLLNLKDRKHLKEISEVCNIPTGKPGRTIFYSIKGLKAP